MSVHSSNFIVQLRPNNQHADSHYDPPLHQCRIFHVHIVMHFRIEKFTHLCDSLINDPSINVGMLLLHVYEEQSV